MADRLWDIARVVLMVVGALTIWAFVTGVVWIWVARRLRGPRDEQAPGIGRRPVADRRATTWANVPSWVTRDREWAAAVVLLGSPNIADRTTGFVDFATRRIDWLGLRLEASGWDRREQMLVEVAYELAESQHQPADEAVSRAPVTVTDLAIGLDGPELDLVHTAVDLRRGAFTLDSLRHTRTPRER